MACKEARLRSTRHDLRDSFFKPIFTSLLMWEYYSGLQQDILHIGEVYNETGAVHCQPHYFKDASPRTPRKEKKTPSSEANNQANM